MSTHVASSLVADRLPAICGSATLAMEVSITSMNVASITEMAISHGLITGSSPGISSQSDAEVTDKVAQTWRRSAIQHPAKAVRPIQFLGKNQN